MEFQNNIEPGEKVNTSTKFYFGIFQFGSQLVHGVFTASLIFFYIEKMLLPEFYIMWAFIIYAIWNAINDPLFGWLSDRTHTKWGRRVPYLRIFTPLMTLSFILLWLSPPISQIGEFGVFLYLLVFMSIYDTAFTAALLVYSALGQELSLDHRERANLQVYAMVFGVFGTLIALLLPDFFLEEPGRENFIILTIILGTIQFLVMGIPSFTIKERLEFSQIENPLKFWNSMKHTLKSKSFLIAVSMNFLLVFIQAVFFGNLFFYLDYAFPDTINSTLILILLLVFTLSGIVFGLFYIMKINNRKGVKKAMIHGTTILGFGFIIGGVLPGIYAVIGFFFIGIGLFGITTLFNSVFGEVADEDEVKTGQRREAAIFGVNALITKPAESIAGVFIALMLAIFLYQPPIGGVQQSQLPITIIGIRLAMGVIPGIIALLSVLILKFFPLQGQYLKDIKSKIYEMHREQKKI